ncbi:unnamed protein product [Choristocarpus tenellus]
MKKFLATRKFPVQVGVVRVHSLGKIKPRGGYHTRERLVPIGFRASRLEHSRRHDSVVHCFLEIIEEPVIPAQELTAQTPGGQGGGATGKLGGEGVGAGTSLLDNGDGFTDLGKAKGDLVGGGAGEGGNVQKVAMYKVSVDCGTEPLEWFRGSTPGKAWRAALRAMGYEVGS